MVCSLFYLQTLFASVDTTILVKSCIIIFGLRLFFSYFWQSQKLEQEFNIPKSNLSRLFFFFLLQLYVATTFIVAREKKRKKKIANEINERKLSVFGHKSYEKKLWKWFTNNQNGANAVAMKIIGNFHVNSSYRFVICITCLKDWIYANSNTFLRFFWMGARERIS